MFQGLQAKSSPFAQSPFAQPATTGFNPPVFGSAANTGLFSGSQPQQSGLFGQTTATPAFGQTQTTTPAFGGFTSSAPGTSLFGAQQNVSSSLFGSNTTTSFGQPKPAFSSFGTQQPGLFQQQQPTQVQQPSLFGQPATQSASGLFGATPGFGGGAPATEGTTIKFVPLTGSDSMLKNGVASTINTRHHCITCMKEYEGKSLEELRVEDYAANRKGPAQGVQPNLFGSTNPSSLFSASTSTGTTSTGLFGGENKSLFGGPQGFGTITNPFGAGTSGSSLFGKPAGAATAFATPASTATNFGGFNSNTSANPFGAQKPFGTTTQAGFFGSTTQPTNAFGTQPTGFATSFQTQPVQNGGLFGQNKQTFPIGQTNAFSFNQPASSGATSSIFGAKPATTGGFGGFGTTATPGTGFTGSTFGANNQNTSSFGANFKAPGTSSFNFGATPTTNTLGTGLTLGGGSSLFGSTKPGGLFSQPSTGLFSSGFGSNTTNFNTGSNTLGALGSTQPFTLGGGLSTGQNTNLTNQPGNLNNSINLMAYGSTPFEDSPIFKNLLTATGKADELIKPTSPATQKSFISGENYKVSPKSSTKVKVIPVESNSTKKLLFHGLDEDEEGTSELLGQTSIRPSSRRLILKSRFSMDSSSQRSTFPGVSNMINELSSPITNCSKVQFRHTSFKTPPVNTSTPAAPSKSNLPKTPISSHLKKVDTPNLDNTMAELRAESAPAKNDPPTSENKDVLSTTSSSDSEMEDTLPPDIDTGAPDHPTGIVLRRIGYYTIPSLDELAELMDSEGRCLVETFTVGRLNYGNIFYPDPFDVAGLNLDETVHFRHKEVVVYPDDDKKPPVGSGLNRRAQVTLDRVWPEDKTTRHPINDHHRLSLMDYETKLRKASAKHGTKFVDYRPQTGSWVFKVEHFSKYGLSDSDEDEPSAQGVTNAKVQDKRLLLKQQQAASVLQLINNKQLNSNLSSTAMMLGEEDEEMDEGINKFYDDLDSIEMRGRDLLSHDLENTFSPTSNLAKELGSSSHKVQLMKASFFDKDFEIDGEFLEYEDIDQPVNFRVGGFSFDARRLSQAYKWYKQNELSILDDGSMQMEDKIDSNSDVCPMEEALIEDQSEDDALCEELPEAQKLYPKTYLVTQRNAVLPYSKMSSFQKSNNCIDMEMFRGRSFKTPWAPQSGLIVLNTESSTSKYLYSTIEGRNHEDSSPYLLEKHNLFHTNATSSVATFEDTVIDHLEITYSHSLLKFEGENPYFTSVLGTSSLKQHFIAARMLASKLIEKKGNLADKNIKLVSQVWGLCVALWGDIDCPEDSHDWAMQRKQAVSQWLEGVTSDLVDEKIMENGSSIYTYMTGHKIAQACEEAQKNGDHHLSLLLSQCESTPEIREMIEKQLIQWRETEADKHIKVDRLKCLMLVAGLPVHRASGEILNSCHELNWLQAFGIHLWYINSKVASFTDSLVAYECASETDEGYAPKPKPFYNNEYDVEATGAKQVYDVIFHLFKLFSVKSHPLEQLLNPATYTPEPLDYRLSWFLMRTLMELGYSHLSLFSMTVITTSFASQLEAEGLWNWAVFVLMHIQDAEERERAIKDVIGKYVSVGDETEKETFLIEKLHLPTEWIYEAKAIRASVLKRYHDAARYFIKSEQWDQAHGVIMKHIFPKAIILSNYDYLEGLLDQLNIGERSKEISNWSGGGSILLKHVKLVKKMTQMMTTKNLSSDENQVERLQTQLQDFCQSIKLIKTSQHLETLSVQEMAKTTINLAHDLASWYRHVDESAVIQFTEYLKELPLTRECLTGKYLSVVEFWNRHYKD